MTTYIVPDNFPNVNSSNTTQEISPQTPIPPWVAPPVDAWALHKWNLVSLFTYYIIAYVFGQFVNWLCLINVRKTNLSTSTRYLMTTQCILNTSYITINFPYKATILYLQRTFLPLPLKVFCGWLHIFMGFGSLFMQGVMAATRLMYIMFPQWAKTWFNTKKRSLIPPMVPVILASLYAFPSLHPCCYRFYNFPSYAMSYVGYKSYIQLRFSFIGSSTSILTMFISYGIVFFKIRRASRAVNTTEDSRQRKKEGKKEIQLTLQFGITGCVWVMYLIFFYSIYWSNLFKGYSTLMMFNEMLESVLFIIDPLVYIILSSELRRQVLRCLGLESMNWGGTSAVTHTANNISKGIGPTGLRRSTIYDSNL